jgi:hypothetical protein
VAASLCRGVTDNPNPQISQIHADSFLNWTLARESFRSWTFGRRPPLPPSLKPQTARILSTMPEAQHIDTATIIVHSVED